MSGERTLQANSPWNYFRRVPNLYVIITIRQRYGRTDGQTNDMPCQYRATALYVASRC